MTRGPLRLPSSSAPAGASAFPSSRWRRAPSAAAACARAGLFDEELLRRGLLTSRDIQRRYFSAVGKRLLKRLSRDGEIRLNGDGLLLDGAEIAELICGESRRPAGMALRRADGGICLRLIPQKERKPKS